MIIKTAKQSGRMAENIAADYLDKQGIKIVHRNFHSRFGEIDLIGLEKQTLLFIEVRFRKNEKHLTVVETINQHKCRKIILTSEYFLNKHRNYQSCQCRYDVIAITGNLDESAIEWIKNAFRLP